MPNVLADLWQLATYFKLATHMGMRHYRYIRHYKQKEKVKKFHSKLKENYKVGSKPDYKYFRKKEKQKQR